MQSTSETSSAGISAGTVYTALEPVDDPELGIGIVPDALDAIPGVKEARIDVTFTPSWDPRTMASDDVKVMLGIW